MNSGKYIDLQHDAYETNDFERLEQLYEKKRIT